MSEPSATTRTSPGKSRSSLASRIAFGGLGLFLFSIVILYAVLWFGNVRGEEFSPNSFQRRRFAYLEFPLIGVQITPIRHSDSTNDLEKYLVANQLLPRRANAEDRWDLASAVHGTSGSTPGNARILCQYLDGVSSDGGSLWLKWSKDHVELAKVLWPSVAKVARDEMYSFIPDLFVLARSATTPEQLQRDIDQSLADKYLLTAETFEALNQTELAGELFAEVLRHAPDRREAVRGRNRSGDAPAKESKDSETSRGET